MIEIDRLSEDGKFLGNGRMRHLHVLWEKTALSSVSDSTQAMLHLLARLSELTGCSGATWLALNRYEPDALPSSLLPFQSVIFELGGWVVTASVSLDPQKEADSEYERWFMYAARGGPDHMTGHMCANAGNARSCIRDDVMTEEEWQGHWFPSKYLSFYGIGERMMMMFPVNGHCEACILIDRPRGAPAFTAVDKHFWHHAMAGIPYLHKQLCAERGVLGFAEPLTPREAETYRLLLTPMSEGEIGGKMNLSAHTVHDYARRIYRKLGVRGRVGLMSMLLRSDGSNSHNGGEKLL